MDQAGDMAMGQAGDTGMDRAGDMAMDQAGDTETSETIDSGTGPWPRAERRGVLVTGCAGFIGSHMVDRLLADGHFVRGIDSFTDHYDPELKRANIQPALTSPRFELIETDLLDVDGHELFDGVDAVVHLAAQPGVRNSWADGFGPYVRNNIEVTQRLLETARHHRLERFVAASSSSIYGDARTYPTTERELPQPVSPYGVTKLAAENLCTLYGTNFGVPTISLRYFNVYGPRQRPDMAFRRLIEAAMSGNEFPLYGDGSAARSFTFVDDVIDANMAALYNPVEPGSVCNISGTVTYSMAELVSMVEQVIGSQIALRRLPRVDGDARRTGGSVDRAVELLGWKPAVDIVEGIRSQAEWQREHRLPAGHPDLQAMA